MKQLFLKKKIQQKPITTINKKYKHMRVWATQNLNYEHKYAGVMLSKMRAIWLEVTIKGNLISVLSHNDPNTKTGVNMGRGVQQKTHKYIIFFFIIIF
jgi:hypothetical protein